MSTFSQHFITTNSFVKNLTFYYQTHYFQVSTAIIIIILAKDLRQLNSAAVAVELHHQQITIIVAVILINISVDVQSSRSETKAKLLNIKVIVINFAFRISSQILVATGYKHYNTH